MHISQLLRRYGEYMVACKPLFPRSFLRRSKSVLLGAYSTKQHSACASGNQTVRHALRAALQTRRLPQLHAE
jgi:hypothetical protein